MASSRRKMQFREWLAFQIAPWLRRRYEPQYDEAFEKLAEVAYGTPSAIWTSPRVLVDVALREARSPSQRLR